MKSMSSKIAMAISLLFFASVNAAADPIDKSQSTLIEKIETYLSKEATEQILMRIEASSNKNEDEVVRTLEEIKNRKQVAEMFDTGEFSGGVCFGLTYLWLYCERMSDEPRTDPSKERDDMDFFNYVTHLLFHWDGVSPFSQSDKSEIERFINYVMIFQRIKYLFPDAIEQDESLKFLSDTHGRTIQISEKLKASRSRLTFENDIKNYFRSKPPVLLSVLFRAFIDTKNGDKTISIERGHILGLYHSTKKDASGSFYGFDPNESSGIQSFSTVEGLAKWAWGRVDPGWIDQGKTKVLRQNLRQVTFQVSVLSAIPEIVFLGKHFLQDLDTALENRSLIAANLNDKRIKDLHYNESDLLIFYKSLNAGVLTEDDKAKINKIIEYVFTSGFPYSDEFKRILMLKVNQLVVNCVNIIKKTCTDIEDSLPAMQPIESKNKPIKDIQGLLATLIDKGEPIAIKEVQDLQAAINELLEAQSKLELLDKEFLIDEYESILSVLDELSETIEKKGGRRHRSIDSCLSGLKLHYDAIERLVSSAVYDRIVATQKYMRSLLKPGNVITDDAIKTGNKLIMEMMSNLEPFASMQSDESLRTKAPKVILAEYENVVAQLELLAQFVAYGPITLPKKTPPPVAPKPVKKPLTPVVVNPVVSPQKKSPAVTLIGHGLYLDEHGHVHPIDEADKDSHDSQS